jgi:hypothetical protein
MKRPAQLLTPQPKQQQQQQAAKRQKGEDGVKLAQSAPAKAPQAKTAAAAAGESTSHSMTAEMGSITVVLPCGFCIAVCFAVFSGFASKLLQKINCVSGHVCRLCLAAAAAGAGK